MKLSTGLLLPALVGKALASSNANVYIVQGQQRPKPSNPPSLSPEETRLVLAQRLGVSHYHSLHGASESTLSHINNFGGHGHSLFQDTTQYEAAELVIIVDGVSTAAADKLLKALSSTKPDFTISNPPPSEANRALVNDLRLQLGSGSKDCAFDEAINPFNHRCWNGKSKALHVDLSKDVKSPVNIEDLLLAQQRLFRFAEKEEMNVVMVLMPESSRAASSSSKPYGTYGMPSQGPMKREQVEEPMEELDEDIETTSLPISNSNQVMGSNTSFEPIRGVLPRCHASPDSCVATTNNCSGHGTCYNKYGSNGTDAASVCFTCGCVPTVNGTSNVTTYWGGPACQKIDVSGPFWLFTGFTVVMIGLVSWAIGMLFSIGEEKLPGVIGAGVSSNKAR